MKAPLSRGFRFPKGRQGPVCWLQKRPFWLQSVSVSVTSALKDVVEERHWVLVRSERDVYTAQLVGQGVVARLDQRDGDRDLGV
jgi:hypothetical protein